MVRRFNLADILLVKRLQGQGACLDLETTLLGSPTPLTMALLEYVSPSAAHISTFVEHDQSMDGRRQGFLQTWNRADRHGCDIVSIAPALAESPVTSQLWRDLLEHAIRVKGEQGMHRIFAKLAQDEPGVDIFRQAGFTTYARRDIFRLDKIPPSPEPTRDRSLRSLEKGDDWKLLRLRSSLTPRLVQMAEGGIIGERDLLGPLPWWRARQVKEYVFADDGNFHAYLCVVVGQEGHWLRIMVQPESPMDVDTILSESLSMLSTYSPRPVYCSLREYEAGVRGGLEELGFQPLASELLMVKQTTVRMSVPVDQLRPALEKGVETAAPISTSNNCEETL